VVSLVDTSVWGWRGRSEAVADVLVALMASERAATCHPVMLEILYSARNIEGFREAREGLEAHIVLPVGPREWARALDVYEALAAAGGSHQRSVQHADLLAAAAAESAGAEVLHYDEDFDRIAAITGQPTRWVVPRGSLG
jgi:predicted nucleic acid-binding protein